MLKRTYHILMILALLIQPGWESIGIYAQNMVKQQFEFATDSLKRLNIVPKDSILSDSLNLRNENEMKLLESPVDTTALLLSIDSIQKEMPSIPKKRFVPNANRAIWLAMVFPGAGQIYNRKYWKLPIVYGGFVACAYALNWNSKMYKDYSQAYLDIMDDDPNTKSFENFIPLNTNISGQEERFKELFRKRKDLYRRQRDLSIFCLEV